MKITRFTEEQIIAAILGQLSGKKTVEKVCRMPSSTCLTRFSTVPFSFGNH
jgi:hypothetical protein